MIEHLGSDPETTKFCLQWPGVGLIDGVRLRALAATDPADAARNLLLSLLRLEEIGPIHPSCRRARDKASRSSCATSASGLDGPWQSAAWRHGAVDRKRVAPTPRPSGSPAGHHLPYWRARPPNQSEP